EDWELGSGSSLLHLLHNFPADSPFVTSAVNCTQRFWLPPSSPVCWGNVAGPEEFARSRLFVLQNRAALQAVSSMSGVEDTGLSYNHQAREEVLGIHSEHQKVKETMQTMEAVFVSLHENRKEGKEQGLKEHLAVTRDAIDWREQTAENLERQLFMVEKSLLNSQLRL
uniref:Si:ch211-57n23.1 n=1 Tax=Kryptolebias marmoratus TaxID=37003 RepID=A0A3Q2ZXH9_KRYMA